MVNSKRYSDVAIDTNLADAEALPMSRALRGHIWVPDSTSLTTVTLYGAASKAGPFVPIQDASGASVQITNIDGSAGIYALPSLAFGIPYVKMVGNVDATVDVSADYDTGRA